MLMVIRRARRTTPRVTRGRIERQRNAPGKAVGRTGDAQVFKRIILQEPENFIAPGVGLDERVVLFNVIDEPALLVLHFEIIIVLHQPGYFPVLRGE